MAGVSGDGRGWQPGSFSRRRIADRIGHGEMYLARLAGQTLGTFALQWLDEEVWGDVPEDAGYVHALAENRGSNGYCERARFRRRGRVRVSGLEVCLYEKRVCFVGAGKHGSPAILLRQCFWIR